MQRMGSLKPVNSGGLVYLVSPELEGFGPFLHAFSTRLGGVSRGPFRSLNLGPAPGERWENVNENRRRFFRAIGLGALKPIALRQVHGNRLIEVRGGGEGGRKSLGDGLMAEEKGLALTISTADCYPIILASLRPRALALLHAGRAGTARGILASAVSGMENAYGVKAEELLAVLGPGIGPCCYEVGEEVAGEFRGTAGALRPGEDGKYFLDLPAVIRSQLHEAGLPEDRIILPGVCTCCEGELFFSHRREGPFTGRLMAVAGLL